MNKVPVKGGWGGGVVGNAFFGFKLMYLNYVIKLSFKLSVILCITHSSH